MDKQFRNTSLRQTGIGLLVLLALLLAGAAHTGQEAHASSVATSTATHFDAVAGQPFTGIVATITSPGSFLSFAEIAWGDGTTSDGSSPESISSPFAVLGQHTYATSGTYATTILAAVCPGLGHPCGAEYVNGVARVSTFGVTGTQFSAVAGQPFTATVATITGPLSSLQISGVTIKRGDGQSSSGTLGILDGRVTAFHEYTKAGTYTTTIVLSFVSGSAAKGNGTATISAS